MTATRQATRRWGIILVTAGALLASCSDAADEGDQRPADNIPTPAAATESGTPTPADATPTTSQSDEQAAAAIAAAEAYLALFTELQRDHDRELTELTELAGGQALDLATDILTWDRDDGYTAVGTRELTDITITAEHLDPGDTPDGHPTVELTGCLDVSNLDVVDDDGNSVVVPTREDRVLVDYVISNMGTEDTPGWLVTEETAQLTETDPPEAEPCP